MCRTWGPRRRLLAPPSEETAAAGGDVPGLFREAPEGRAKPTPAPEVRGTMRNTLLTCHGLGQPRWRQMDPADDRADPGSLSYGAKEEKSARRSRKHDGAVVNCSPASSGFGGRARES